MWLLWTSLAIASVACWIYLGMTTFRKGHCGLFWIGFLFPILWIIGALIAPTDRGRAPIDRAAARGVTRSRPGESRMSIAKSVRNRARVFVISGRTVLSEDGVS